MPVLSVPKKMFYPSWQGALSFSLLIHVSGNINITSKRAPVPKDQKDHAVKVQNGICARGNEKHSEMDSSLHQRQGSSNTRCQTKDPSKCLRAFQSRQQQSLHASFPRNLFLASPIISSISCLPPVPSPCRRQSR